MPGLNNARIEAEIEVTTTLQNGQRLEVVTIAEEYLGEVDNCLNYVEEALEEAEKEEYWQVHWAEYAMVKIVERYIKPEASSIHEEDLYGDAYDPEIERQF